MIFKRKVYDKLLNWKTKYADSYSVLLEGARRVGKSTIAEEFAKNEYSSYIIIDFANASKEILDCFEDISDLDMFFLRLQSVCGINLVQSDSLIVFDEVQLFPKARQAIKYLVKDGRYHYLETGSLISIKKNVKDIIIPSEEMKINVHPMDFEEFCLAAKMNSYQMAKSFYNVGKPIGDKINRKILRDLRLYMAVGGMPQAVAAFVKGSNFNEIDKIKRLIIKLYEDDFKKIDPSGRISAMYRSIPSQISIDAKQFLISRAIGKRKSSKSEEILYDLIDSNTVLMAYNTRDPRVSLSQSKDFSSYKLYLADTGLFITLMFIDKDETENEIYKKLLSDKLPANLGYLYENLVAQTIRSFDRDLYYHTWEKENSTHYYEIDFLLSEKDKINAVEVKSSGIGNFSSLKMFKNKYSANLNRALLLSKKDISKNDGIEFMPIYMINFICE